MNKKVLAAVLGLVVAASAVAAGPAEPVRFSMTCDNRGFPGFAGVLEAMKKAPGGPGAFMVSPGDVSPPQNTRAALDKAFGPSFGWYPAMGNHELPPTRKPPQPAADTPAGKATDAKSAKDLPQPPASEAHVRYLREYYAKNLKGKVNPGPQGTEETTYSFDFGPVHLVVINLYWNGKTDPGSDVGAAVDVVEPLREWVRADLKASTQPWKLVFGHDPMFPQPDRNWESKRHTTGDMLKREKNRDAFWAMLNETGATAYVCGHTHRYSRYRPEGSKVWQIDAAQARGGKDWKYDAFILVAADTRSLKVEVYRNLKEPGKFTLADWLKFTPQGVQEGPEPERPAPATTPAATNAAPAAR